MNRVVFVSGGNRGIGKEICRQLADLGHHVILGSRSLEKGHEAAQSMGENVKAVEFDVTRKDHMDKALLEINKLHGKLDVLINNAGIISSESGVKDVPLDEIKKVMETNVFGIQEMMQRSRKLLMQSNDPRIINISSGMGAWNSMIDGYTGYRLSKISLNALTLIWANAVEGEIKVNGMCPGWVRTAMGGKHATRSVEQGAETAVWLATSDDIPHGKFLRDRQVIPW
jgi:NAD(P)-dependent dehydrogenase (short-subunit alcohol dehydrogenase family)